MDLSLILKLLGGLALFLYGMQMMSDGLEKAAGDRLKTILEKLTSNRILGVIVGALITAAIQSSSATTVMVIGFVIGTTLALLNSTHFSLSEISDFEILSTQTADGLSQLWDTKVFFFATWLTAYYTLSKNRRRRIFRIIRQQKLLSYCLLFSVCTIPFAPLGMDYAIEGVCFFCMFWVLFLFQDLVRHIRYKRHRFLSSRRTQRDSHIF